MDTNKLTRKERRALAFGTQEQVAAIQAKYKRRDPFYVVPYNGKIMLPVITGEDRDILPFIRREDQIPLECGAAARSHTQIRTHHGVAKTCEDYADLFYMHFFCGLKTLKPTFKSNVVSEDAAISVEHAFMVLVSESMRDLRLSQEHKAAHTIYLYYTCCEQVEWEARK